MLSPAPLKLIMFDGYEPITQPLCDCCRMTEADLQEHALRDKYPEAFPLYKFVTELATCDICAPKMAGIYQRTLLMNALPTRLRIVRGKLGLTSGQLARMTNTHTSHVNKQLSGKRRPTVLLLGVLNKSILDHNRQGSGSLFSYLLKAPVARRKS